MRLIDRALFAIYKHATSFAIYRSFKNQKVYPITDPIEEKVELVPFNQGEGDGDIENLYTVKSYPEADHASERKRAAKINKIGSSFLRILNRSGLPAISSDHDEFLKAVYPYFLRKAWPQAPQVPPELRDTSDVVGALALSGPFADYVRKPTDAEITEINAMRDDHVNNASFVLSTEFLSSYPVKEGLSPLGSKAILTYDPAHGKMVTQSILYRGRLITPEEEGWRQAQKITLCGMSTHLTLVKHNLYTHLILTTLCTAVSINRLNPSHPLRRLLHPCFQMALIGNYEVEQFHIRGPKTYFTTLFSYEHATVNKLLTDFVAAFDIRRLDPVLDLRMREMEDEELAYPFKRNVVPLWWTIYNYVSDYVDHYYAGDDALREDQEIRAWYEELDRLIPNGLRSYAPEISKESVKKVAALYIYNATVAHENLNNIVWNYITLNQIIPTIVPSNGELQPINISFDFLITVLITWKPFNMLLFDDFSGIALDDGGKQIMQSFIRNLKSQQDEMENQEFKYYWIYPRNLNYSVSQ